MGLVPAGVAVAWVPLRHTLPNTDLALVLVVLIAGCGFLGGRAGTLVGAFGAGVSFDLLHTSPYGHLAITHGRDALTTALLVVAGLVVGEVAFRLGRYRQRAESEADAFALVTDAAGVVATGGETSLVLAAIATELQEGLGLGDCVYESGPPKGDVPFVARDGQLVRLDDTAPARSPGAVDLPIWSSGEIVARFRLAFDESSPALTAARLQLAISLSDQAGAALSATPGPAPSEPSDRRRGLRLVRS